ncbi:hypothetical protein BC829DRAFT_419734 [Chytridium lagenaria]|nr:hypothetical protein BC829DRAFT_419734 [Chytridium lagenaria]
MDPLQNRILHTVAHHDPTPAADPTEDPDEWLPYPAEADMDESEELIEDMAEQDLLAEMDRMEDSLLIARRLFHVKPSTPHPVNEIMIPGPVEASHPFSEVETRSVPNTALEALWRQGFTFVDGLLDATVVGEARNRAIQMANEGLLIPAGEVRMDDDPFRDRKARDDVITWLHPTDPLHPALLTVVNLLKSIQQDLGGVMHMNGEAEYQLALYRGNGGRYERHRDAFPNDQPEDVEQRRVTGILYLTSPESRGGCDGSLRVYRPLDRADGVEIEAVPGRLVLFLSGVVDHEVMPVFGERVAVTAWMR